MIRLYFLVFMLLAMQVAVSWAGQQREEHLADSVRTAMGTAVTGLTPPQPFLATPADKQVYAQWLQRNLQTLNVRLRQIHGNAGLPELATPELQTMFLQTVWYESSRAALDPSLVLGLMEVESGFRKYAVSGAGAMGVMQVMPFWPRLLTQGDATALFQWQANMRFGCVILRHYLKIENGDVFMALGRYNGVRGQRAYPNAVMAAQQLWLP
ncbi:MAG: lytic transglycosylase domain-containing protein [Betaproteobacteria bacterium]|nr:lytic transglycosylase domain-containing protein [Betaproteobacteria bacterium]